MKIKLAVDRSRNLVLFAEAGSDFVDVLLSFLTLPLSAVKFCAGESSPGCLSSLCESVGHLRDRKLLKYDSCRGMLLRPGYYNEFEYCRSPRNHYNTLARTLQAHAPSCKCWEVMARVAHAYYVESRAETLVKRNQLFVISDDWVIKPASTSNKMSLLQKVGYDTIGYSVEEVQVCIGWAEVESMLKTSFSSKTIFTKTFLSKETDQAPHATFAPIYDRNILHQSDKDPDCSTQQFNIKVFFDRQERKVIYAECKHEFVDLLLSFLAYPVSCLIKNLAGTSHLGCSLDNLYASAIDLDVADLFGRHGSPRETLLYPSIAPFDVFRNGSKRAVPEWFYLCQTPRCQCSKVGMANKKCCVCDSQFVDNDTYIVHDDLLIYQVSPVLVMKHWCKIDKDNVLEMDIAISKQEAVNLLRAALTSKTALTDVFISRLGEEHQVSSWLPQMDFQILVKIHTSKTITLYVETTVKSRIHDKLRLPLPAHYPYVLVYHSRHLQDWCTIADYNIMKGSTIHYATYMRDDHRDENGSN